MVNYWVNKPARTLDACLFYLEIYWVDKPHSLEQKLDQNWELPFFSPFFVTGFGKDPFMKLVCFLWSTNQPMRKGHFEGKGQAQ